MIGKALGDKYSDISVKHIYRALRLSSSSSLRSSLTSSSSRTSSLLSRYSSRHSTATNDELSKEELEVWDVLVDEGKMEPPLIPGPSYYSPLNTRCCMSRLSPTISRMCETCGSTTQHRLAIVLADLSRISLSPMTNFYGDTVLHCAAGAVATGEFWKVRAMVDQGANIHTRNTVGETFLHVLCRHGPRSSLDSMEILEILKIVSRAAFPFSMPDYHGHTILHNLFQHLNESILGISVLSDIFSVTKPLLWKSQFNTADNAGNRLLDILRDACRRIGKNSYTDGIENLVNTNIWNSVRDITQTPSLAHYLAGMISEEDLHKWLGDLPRSQPITWIDSAGDTPLTAVLKSGLSLTIPDVTLGAITEHMVKTMGAEIHMRDRNGETALAIAARRGFHSVVTVLVELGANVNSRDYRGVGILAQTKRSNSLTPLNEKDWAMIWSCRIALIDAGAKYKPTNEDEWMIPPSKQREMLEARSPATRHANGLWYPS